MGFFDDNPGIDVGGGSAFLTKEEKQVLIASGDTFTVKSVSGPTPTDYGPRFVVEIEIEGESRLIGFSSGKVGSRDRVLLALQDYIGTKGAPDDLFRLEINGRSQVLRNAAVSV